MRVEGLLKAAVYNGQNDVVAKMMDDNRVAIKLQVNSDTIQRNCQ